MVNTTRGVLNTHKSFLFGAGAESQCCLRLQMCAKNVEKMDLFGASDPYCIFYLASGHGKDKTYSEIYRSEVIQNTLNPVWKTVVKSVREFCDNDYDRRIRVKMLDWSGGGNTGEVEQQREDNGAVNGCFKNVNWMLMLVFYFFCVCALFLSSATIRPTGTWPASTISSAPST
jgi:phospholipase/lecithinase/hemolysin